MKNLLNKKNNLQLNNKNAGFTLMEALTGALLGAIILIIIYTSFTTGQKLNKQGLLNSEVAQNGRIAMDRISRELRQTGQLVTILSENPPDPAQTEIMFEDGHTDTIQYIRYYLSGTDLRKEIRHYYFPAEPETWVNDSARDGYGQPASSAVDSDQIISQFVASLNFYGEKTISIDLSIEKSGKRIDFQTKNLGRNL